MLPDKRDHLVRAIAKARVLERGVIRTSVLDSALLMIVYLPLAPSSVSLKLGTTAPSKQTFADKEPQHGHLHQIAGGA